MLNFDMPMLAASLETWARFTGSWLEYTPPMLAYRAVYTAQAMGAMIMVEATKALFTRKEDKAA